jgi:hypothetical protein
MDVAIRSMSETNNAQSGTSLCSFCLENGWANLSLDKKKHDDSELNAHKWKYEIKSQQLQHSIKDSCWWCENVGNAILENDEHAFNQDAIATSYEVLMILLEAERRQPPLLGQLLVDIDGMQDDGEVVFEHRINCGIFAKQGKNLRLFIAKWHTG